MNKLIVIELTITKLNDKTYFVLIKLKYYF